ncbi:MAG: glycosyltransferase family 2 protein [Alcaligenaceae bacterium]|nr:MAG: glycosyltransferase family 2 protein [Alcaligenaceae bacterium]
MNLSTSVAVIIPCYRVKRHILGVIAQIGPEVAAIYVVDDCCPEDSGNFVAQQCLDPRLQVVFHEQNQGVGGAVMSGYRAAIADGHTILVKVDGDGQMDPSLLPIFVSPLLAGEADYAKGNRFYHLDEIHNMPAVRLFGNAALSFMSKLSTGYWSIFDPTNGYTAIHAKVASHLPMDKISKRYFFETDMLFRLNTLRATVVDVPMDAVYGDEESNLRITKILPEFLSKHIRNTFKRVFYNYYLRDMSVASLQLPVGIVLMCFGAIYGLVHWIQSSSLNIPSPAGTVMLAALPVITGLHMLLSFVANDVANQPQKPIHKLLHYRARKTHATSLDKKS